MSMTPQQLFDQLVAELSASGSTPLVNGDDGKPATLREAIGALLWKQTTLLDLTDRPRTPTATDDQYGHVLSTHAIVLQTQALAAALCVAHGVDVKATLHAATVSYTP